VFNVDEIDSWARFYQTCFLPSKNIAVQFLQPFKLQILSTNLRTFCQICLPFAKHCVQKKVSHPVHEKKPGKYVDEIDPWCFKIE